MKTKRKKKAPVKRRTSVARTRNSGTLTEGGFWGMIRQTLRNRTRFWKPITDARNQARRAYKGSNRRQKFEYKCYICENYFPVKEIEVHHQVPAGKLSCYEDLAGFVERLFSETGYIVACKNCHKIEHDKIETNGNSN